MNFVTSYTMQGSGNELSLQVGRKRSTNTLLVQKNVQAILGPVLLELSVGDELRHVGEMGDRGREWREGTQRQRWVRPGDKSQSRYMSRADSHVASRIMPKTVD